MLNKYNHDIPNDLVLMPANDSVPADIIKKILEIDWFEYHGILLASFQDLSSIGLDEESTLEDIGYCAYTIDDILRIPHPLKRYNDYDGFYHS
jgi:hypothetical protein